MVEGGSLENYCTRKGTGGSNPSLSVFFILFFFILFVYIFFTFFYFLSIFFDFYSIFKVFILINGEVRESVESGSLLRSYTPKGYRGFESPPLRFFYFTSIIFAFVISSKSFEDILKTLFGVPAAAQTNLKFSSSLSI